jgi:4-alpha-glucanotransferase
VKESADNSTSRENGAAPRSASRRRGVARAPKSSRSPAFDLDRRASGILMHVTSLPGPHGSGDLGAEAHRFVDFLASAGQSWWQMLPVGPPGRAPGFSPYDSSSAFAGNPWLVSLELLASAGRLAVEDVAPVRGLGAREVEFELVARFREDRLERAFVAFERARGAESREFRTFCRASADWLDDFALFAALRRECGGRPWIEWESGLRQREDASLRAARERLAREIDEQRFVQFEFDRQWRSLREHAHRRGIGLIGDLPIFVAHDSADAWSHPELFELDRSGRAKRVSGYPPDRFNANGQLWGHPQYAWPEHERTGFAWWLRRFARTFELFDAVRVDHFLGFTRTWSIPSQARDDAASRAREASAREHGASAHEHHASAREPDASARERDASAEARDAKHGRWVRSPGFELFSALERKLGRLPLIAEDLGHVTADDVRLRDRFGLAPMRIFQFGFGSEADSAQHLPHNYARRTAAYTGNHDTDTTAGWLGSLSAAERERVLAYVAGTRSTAVRAAIRALMASHAGTVVFPMQDVLGLDHRARMNTPGTASGNWRWRMPAAKLESRARELAELVETFGRAAHAPESERTTSIRSRAFATETEIGSRAAIHDISHDITATAEDQES